MSRSFDLDAPEHFTVGAVGRPGERVFYLQARQARTVVTLKCEKEQMRALGEYLARLLAELPGPAAAAADERTLQEPLEPAWAVATLALGYDEARDRVTIVATEFREEETGDEAATARFHITRAQAAAFVERARALMKGGRPLCPMCSEPKDPAGHVCPRANGHVVR